MERKQHFVGLRAESALAGMGHHALLPMTQAGRGAGQSSSVHHPLLTVTGLDCIWMRAPRPTFSKARAWLVIRASWDEAALGITALTPLLSYTTTWPPAPALVWDCACVPGVGFNPRETSPTRTPGRLLWPDPK